MAGTINLTPKGKIVAMAVAGVILFGLLLYVFAVRSSNTTTSPKEIIKTETPRQYRGFLPYSTDSFSIDYIADTDTYSVNIYAEPVERHKEEALDYLRRNRADIEKSEVVFFLSGDVSERSGP